jgi:23S rRNA pseudouridine2605 synthase
MKARLQKVLASMGLASRREAEEMIRRGEVVVNGRVAKIGESAEPEVDDIQVGGKPISRQEQMVYVALNKPTGYVTSTRRMGVDPTVLELVSLEQRVFPAGRLDKDTSGLLLLTNDGDWANLVTHPRYKTEKEYRAVVRGEVSQRALDRMRSGVELPGGSKTAPAQVSRAASSNTGNTTLFLILLEGKKRQIRQMCQVLGHPVLSLERVRVGPVKVDGMKPGGWRPLELEEIEAIREQAKRAT